MGYCFFFPGILVGPASDYASYHSLIEGTLFVKPVGTNEASRFALKENEGRLSSKSSEGVKGEERKDRDLEPLVESSLPQPHARLLIPRGRKTIAYLKLVVGLGMLGFYSVFGGKMAYERIVGEEAWWSAKGWFARWVYVMIAGFTARTKYYAIWSISEVSSLPSHLSDLSHLFP
jgi:lysophospholipid acyltransferase